MAPCVSGAEPRHWSRHAVWPRDSLLPGFWQEHGYEGQTCSARWLQWCLFNLALSGLIFQHLTKHWHPCGVGGGWLIAGHTYSAPRGLTSSPSVSVEILRQFCAGWSLGAGCAGGTGQSITSVPQFPHQRKQEVVPYPVAVRRGLTAVALSIAQCSKT